VCKLQASPIDGRQADFSGATLSDCYMSNSDLSNAVFQGVVIERCDFSSSEMPPIVSAIKKYRKQEIKRFGTVFGEKVDNVQKRLNDLRENFYLVDSSVHQRHYARTRIGKVVAVVDRKGAVVKVEVQTKPRIMGNGKEFSRLVTHSVHAGQVSLSLGQKVEIINEKKESRAEKHSRNRARKNIKLTPGNYRRKDRWLISNVKMVGD
jgi:hypothetical protein